MIIEIDKNSGFCFGVIRAIDKAEKILKETDSLYCLGHIVHNKEEVERLQKMGLKIIDFDGFKKLKDCAVLIRAHGEPPETYELARKNNIELLDATCSVVLKLQEKIKKSYNEIKNIKGQVVIYGKEGHAEVIGLTGQINNKAIIVKNQHDLKKIDFLRPVRLFAQTTMSKTGFEEIKNTIKQKMKETQGTDFVDFDARNTVCGQVSCREPAMAEFSAQHDLILFVSGKESSNGKILFNTCLKHNQKSFFIENIHEINNKWFQDVSSVGICGATSTPLWLLHQVADYVNQLNK